MTYLILLFFILVFCDRSAIIVLLMFVFCLMSMLHGRCKSDVCLQCIPILLCGFNFGVTFMAAVSFY